MTMTPNGKYAIIGQSLGAPKIWDTTNGQLIRGMNGACSSCSNLILACNGTLLVGLASDGSLEGNALNLQLWEVQTGRPIQLTHQIKFCVFALSSDSKSIFMTGNQRFGRGISVGIIDLVSNELVKEIKSDPNISFGDFPESVVITPDEKHAIVGCKSISGTNFVVFDLTKTTEIAQTRSIALDAEPKCIQVLNNNEVLTGTRGSHIVQWNIQSCKPTVTFVDPNENRAHNAIVNQIVLSPDKEYLASVSSDGTGKVWNTSTKQLIAVMTGHQGEAFFRFIRVLIMIFFCLT
jgi:WD40 repeat protein